MNRLGLNILLVLLLSGCSTNRTDSKGEKISANAPMFITPKANATPPNKANTNPITPNKPAAGVTEIQIIFCIYYCTSSVVIM